VDVVEQEHGCKFDPSFPTVLEWGYYGLVCGRE
jgi:hypothetical protein